MKNLQLLNQFFKLILLNCIIQFVLRLAETVLIIVDYGLQDKLLSAELLGVLYDLITTNAILITCYPIYVLLSRLSHKLAGLTFLSLFFIGVLLHFSILKYFLYQLLLLDTFLFHYSIEEILLTINTSGTSYIKSIVSILGSLIVLYVGYRYLKKESFSPKVVLTGFSFALFSIPFAVVIQQIGLYNFNIFSQNKSLFFYSRSIIYFFEENLENQIYSEQDVIDFQTLNNNHVYLDKEYPLLHKFANTDSLSTYFNAFDDVPNIVILMIEGLNDDFMHNYRGAYLMPFLDSLKNKSLYWNQCLTLGERSFSVVPTIFGSLPYGQKGFMILDKMPRHLSLLSILNKNGYFTSFFHNQSNWFHQKDKFFEQNDTDLLIDKERFSEKYEKIIVGKDNYFWGYNDKDLFNQSLEIIDTIGVQPRLDVYFTGTSHSPYVITDEEYYEQKFSEMLKELNSEADVQFFKTYKKFLLSIIFENDALEDFFEAYQKRSDYENTLFIITGDHPMTEIPAPSSLKRYHVPLLLFSEKLKGAKTFSNVVSHLDIYETLLSFLGTYDVKIPTVSTAIGSQLFAVDSLGRHIAFMNDNREIVDYYSDGFYLSRQQVYQVGEGFLLTKTKDRGIYERLQKELKIFKKTNLHVSLKGKIISDSVFCQQLNRSIILSSKDTSRVTFDSEFQNIIQPIKVPNRTQYFDVMVKYEGDIDASTSLVYELKTKEGKSVYWGNSGLHNRKNSLQVHVKIPPSNVADSTLLFKSYWWNPQKRQTTYFDMEMSLQVENQ